MTPAAWSVKTKSAVLLGGFAVLLSVVYGGFTAYLVHRETAAAHDRLAQTATLVAAEIDARLSLGKQRLATVAKLPGLVHGLQRMEEAKGAHYIPPWTTLHYLFFKSPAFNGGVFLADRAGRVLWTEPPGLPWLGDRFGGQPTVATALAEPGTVVSPGLGPDRLLAAPHVLVATRIEAPDGTVTGLLGGLIDLTSSDFSDVVAIPGSAGRRVAVVDQEGRVVSSSDPTLLLAPVADDVGIAGADDPQAEAALDGAPWRVIAGEPRATALAPIHALQRVLAVLGAVVLLAAIAVASRLIGGFVGAIERLTTAAETMAHGDLTQMVAVDERHHELATLGRTFERMRTELRASQVALTRRLAEREDLMRLKEEFLANVSHELRTPLNVIFGYTDMLLEEEERADRRDALDRIRAQSGQLLELVTDLMTLSGLNAGRLALTCEPVAVAPLVARLGGLMEQLARGRPVDALVECAPDLPDLRTDRVRLEQILTNLLANAFKFTTAGAVTLRVWPTDGGRRVAFAVRDTGAGIPDDELPYVFDEFRQVDGSMSRSHAGLGLGLALVKRLTGFLGGTVTARSRLGVGSTFTVTLPTDRDDRDAAPAERAA